MDIADSPPDIIMITEVIPKAQVLPIPQARLAIPGYSMYLNFEADMTDLGNLGIRGVAIFIKENIGANAISLLETSSVENLWLNIKIQGNDNLLLGCIYRSPSGNSAAQRESTEQVCELLRDAASRNNSHLVIAGDFNYPEIDWKNMLSRAGTSHHSHLFIQCVQESFLFQSVDEPTRFRIGTQPNTLDLLLSNEDGMITDVVYKPGLGHSDHVVIDFSIKCYADDPVETQKRDMKKGDFDRAREMMRDTDWKNLLEELDLDTALEVFSSKLQEIVESCIPLRKKSRKKSIYMNKHALGVRKKKYGHWKRFSTTQCYSDYVEFTKERNNLRKLTRQLRREFEHKLAKEVKKNPKSFWNYVNSRLKCRTRIDDIEKADGTLTENGMEQAEAFNQYFCQVFTKEDTTEIPVPEYNFNGRVLEDLVITDEKILKKIRKLNRGKSPGPDGLHPWLLSELDDCLCEPLRILFRKSIDAGKLAEAWKMGHVIPIHKKGRELQTSVPHRHHC